MLGGLVFVSSILVLFSSQDGKTNKTNDSSGIDAFILLKNLQNIFQEK